MKGFLIGAGLSGTMVAGLAFSMVPPPAGMTAEQATAEQATGPCSPIEKAIADAGFAGEDFQIALAVAQAESGLNPDAVNPENTNGSTDYGLFQINTVHKDILASGDWSDPGDNARMAFQVWEAAGRSWDPWVTFDQGLHTPFLKPGQECAAPVVAGKCGRVEAKKYANGRIPDSALCPLWADSSHRLRGDAAAAFDELSKAYEQHFGSKPCITDSYRSYAAQVDVRRRKPGLAAVPGTSNHGWGVALDMCGGAQSFGTPQYQWIAANGGRFGWVNPPWAQSGGSKPEPWHIEFQS